MYLLGGEYVFFFLSFDLSINLSIVNLITYVCQCACRHIACNNLYKENTALNMQIKMTLNFL